MLSVVETLHRGVRDEVVEMCVVNPNAPAALSLFAFLIGTWRCDARVKSANGEWQTLQATWLGRFILDGYAIADEYKMTDPKGELIVLGMNLRAYDAAKQLWNLKWLNALAGTWVDLGPEGLGGVTFDGRSIVYHHRGQLVVYLRLLDVPVPSVYGPTADENPFAAA